MNIGITTAFFQNFRAGTWVYTINLLKALDEASDVERRFFTLDFLDRPMLGLRNIPHRIYPFPNTKLAKLFWPNLVLPRCAQRDGFDLVHATSHYGTFVGCDYRNVITVHDVTPVTHPETHGGLQVFYHRHVLPRVLRRADAVIAISESTKRDIIQCYGLPEAKIRVIHHGVEERFSPKAGAVGEFYRMLPERYILNIGTLEARKNLPRLLEAFASARKRGLPHKLLIGGASGWRLSNLAAIVERLGLEDAVVFLGFVEDRDLPALYARADFFVYPSLYEGFGMPILEAMASGTPVITSNCSSMPEVAGDAALLVDPRDPADIAAKMLALAGSAELREDLRLKGIANASRFTWRETAQRTLAVYREVC